MSTLAKEVWVAEKALKIKGWVGFLCDSKVVNLTKFGVIYSFVEMFSCDKLFHVYPLDVSYNLQDKKVRFRG